MKYFILLPILFITNVYSTPNTNTISSTMNGAVYVGTTVAASIGQEVWQTSTGTLTGNSNISTLNNVPTISSSITGTASSISGGTGIVLPSFTITDINGNVQGVSAISTGTISTIVTDFPLISLLLLSFNTIADQNVNIPVTSNTGVDARNQSNSTGSDLSKAVGVAIAPSLTTTLTETCMGSTSLGAGMSGGSVVFGTTWEDEACVRRLDARELKSIGDAEASKELMCSSKAVRKAFKSVGRPCKVDVIEKLIQLHE